MSNWLTKALAELAFAAISASAQRKLSIARFHQQRRAGGTPGAFVGPNLKAEVAGFDAEQPHLFVTFVAHGPLVTGQMVNFDSGVRHCTTRYAIPNHSNLTGRRT
jgi:hypothetical protein